MADTNDEGLLLGRQVPVSEHYAPELLYPIPRRLARDALGIDASALPFEGVDLWHAYELSWLDGQGRPVSRVGRFSVPAHSANLVESKSFKLYLNSLNQESFESDDEAVQRICTDLSAAAGAEVGLTLFAPDDPGLAGQALPGACLDDLPGRWRAGEPDASQLAQGRAGAMEVHTHLLRSLCPVTGQPDWASVWIAMTGASVDGVSLLNYLLAYRNHQEFHEQCVERIFLDLQSACAPAELHVQAFYTRRGGLDITPFRSTGGRLPLPRMNRQ
ncbi:NADPH-dependent 7-cyano-7-deazaguanine reductase QueF [Parahaliea aestuarii]|uniref:NADPH-dependent 7-cyano-7-deazaguanine reductase QueF n=1 Tax=Parahaliea aestuarii TaxID=1852021 RepID=A0A5C8ZT74_9GAMM|nr:NADPH-dependent 7-cyano-7-deazaguanine reductase QueF [Parahaliea aestuarii]TXS90994.1 NADPH-dependent 7-cyano-7-deazaguanine reductase QueF [Parahaliea aestuarii]